jgi:hypothetical protein
MMATPPLDALICDVKKHAVAIVSASATEEGVIRDFVDRFRRRNRRFISVLCCVLLSVMMYVVYELHNLSTS